MGILIVSLIMIIGGNNLHNRANNNITIIFFK
jgi:hypothetical protein